MTVTVALATGAGVEPLVTFTSTLGSAKVIAVVPPEVTVVAVGRTLPG